MVRQAPKRKKKESKPERPSPTPLITKIGSLKKFPDYEEANNILHQLAILVAPLMHEENFKIGLFCEMFPKSENLLGLNVNRGARILIRLRYHNNPRSFLPITDLIGTVLHELTHNIFGPHDVKFYNKWDQLKTRFQQIQINGSLKETGYLCESNKLGGSAVISERNARIARLSVAKYKSEAKRLGGNSNQKNSGMSMRELILEATMRRIADSKWCDGEHEGSVEGFDDNDLQIFEVQSPISAVDDKLKTEKSLSSDRSNGNFDFKKPEIEIIDISEDENMPKRQKISVYTKSQKATPKKVEKEQEIIIID